MNTQNMVVGLNERVMGDSPKVNIPDKTISEKEFGKMIGGKTTIQVTESYNRIQYTQKTTFTIIRKRAVIVKLIFH
jgi:hypothetical protein